jgi:type IX secretion system PorP/SprF family membrane protein
MMKKKSLFIGGLILGSMLTTQGQDFMPSQFYEITTLRNPALVGIMPSNIRFTGNFRDQWSAVTVPFRTGTFLVESKIPILKSSDFISFATQITRDEAGDSKLQRSQSYLSTTYHKALTSGEDEIPYFLSFSMMGGYIWSGFDPTKMTFDDQFVGGTFNPGAPTSTVFNRTAIQYFDLSTGLAFSGQTYMGSKFYVGVAGYHLTRSNVNFFRDDAVILKPRYVINAGLSVLTGETDRFYFYGDVNLQGGNRQFLMGAIYKWNLASYEEDDEEQNTTSLRLGAAIRWGDAIIPLCKLYHRGLSVGLSYDANISKLKSFTQTVGGFEATLGYSALLRKFLNRGERGSNVECSKVLSL